MKTLIRNFLSGTIKFTEKLNSLLKIEGEGAAICAQVVRLHTQTTPPSQLAQCSLSSRDGDLPTSKKPPSVVDTCNVFQKLFILFY